MGMFSSLAEFIEFVKLINNFEAILASLSEGYFVTFKYLNNACCLATAITGEYVIETIRFSNQSSDSVYVELA